MPGGNKPLGKLRHRSSSNKKNARSEAAVEEASDEKDQGEDVEKTEAKEINDSADKGDAREPPFRTRRHHRRGGYSSYDDPNALCCAVFVKNRFSARVLYHFLKDLARNDVEYSFLTPQYAISLPDPKEDLGDFDEGDQRKQEEALRKFRMRECNLLISNSTLEVGVDGVRCNLVVALDPPETFRSYVHYKVKAKAAAPWFLVFNQEDAKEDIVRALSLYHVLEKKFMSRCYIQGLSKVELLGNQKDWMNVLIRPSALGKFPLTAAKESVILLNRYCAKLPSDTL